MDDDGRMDDDGWIMTMETDNGDQDEDEDDDDDG